MMIKKEQKHLYDDTGLSSHMEDYMETIWILSSENRVVRVKDIARSLNIKMPSVSAALTKLREMDLIDYEKYGFIELTEKGKSIAQLVYNRHECLYKFFSKVLLLDDKDADSEACKVEHVLEPETCRKLHRFLFYFNSEDEKGKAWVRELAKALQN